MCVCLCVSVWIVWRVCMWYVCVHACMRVVCALIITSWMCLTSPWCQLCVFEMHPVSVGCACFRWVSQSIVYAGVVPCVSVACLRCPHPSCVCQSCPHSVCTGDDEPADDEVEEDNRVEGEGLASLRLTLCQKCCRRCNNKKTT